MRTVVLVAALLGLVSNPGPHARAAEPGRRAYAVAIHGGAGLWQGLTPAETATIRQTLTRTLTQARDELASGASSLDVVEQAIRALEDAPQFNAGKGAVFNAEGKHQLDASIMDGRNRTGGGVAAVGVVKNPISLARLVMTETKHVLLVGHGADAFARQVGAETVDADYFWTEKTRREWEAGQAARFTARMPDHFGTVGCVALDQEGHLAAGTSTGGLSLKKFGRVGDSPLIAAGTYADDRTCAVSCTGVGELFIRNAIAYDVAARLRYTGSGLKDAVGYQINQLLPAGTGGIIAVDAQGNIEAAFNTRAMPRALADSSGRFEVAIEADAEN